MSEPRATTLLGLTEDVVRESLLDLVCPWCSTGPWNVVAQHVVRAHGVRSADLRDFAGLTDRSNIISDETRLRLRTSAETHSRFPLDESSRGKNRRLTKAESRRRLALAQNSAGNVTRWQAPGVLCKSGRHPRTGDNLTADHVCAACKRESYRRASARRRESGTLPVVHGLSGRTNHGCKCETCMAAFRDYKRAYRARLKATRS